jgi:ferredoxin
MAEKKIAGLTVIIEPDQCIGTGACVSIAPSHLEMNDRNVVSFVENPTEDISREAIIEACEVCPVEALRVLDETGEQIVG